MFDSLFDSIFRMMRMLDQIPLPVLAYKAGLLIVEASCHSEQCFAATLLSPDLGELPLLLLVSQ